MTIVWGFDFSEKNPTFPNPGRRQEEEDWKLGGSPLNLTYQEIPSSIDWILFNTNELIRI